jgi:predicted kinase
MLLTGGPASGKSATAAELAKTLPRVAVIDVDDIRHLVVAGHAAPWDGDEGVLQQRIGVENSCDLARRFLGAGIEVVMADVLNDAAAALYRRLVPSVVIVRLRLPLREARRRATLRPRHLTDREFEDLHAMEVTNTFPADHDIQVGGLSLEEQRDAVMQLWSNVR